MATSAAGKRIGIRRELALWPPQKFCNNHDGRTATAEFPHCSFWAILKCLLLLLQYSPPTGVLRTVWHKAKCSKKKIVTLRFLSIPQKSKAYQFHSIIMATSAAVKKKQGFPVRWTYTWPPHNICKNQDGCTATAEFL